MDDEWRWQQVGEETEKLLRTVRAKKDGMDFRLWTGESPRGIAIPFPRPKRKGREEKRPSAILAVMEESSQPKRIRVPPAAVPAAKDGPGDGNVAGVVISLPQRFADNR